MATAILAYVDDLVDAIRNLAAAAIGRASNPPHDNEDEDEGE